MRQNPRQVKTFPLNLRPDGCITHGRGMAVGDKDSNVSRSWTFCVILQHVHCAEQNQNKSNIVLMWNLQNQQGKDSTFCLDLARARRQKNAKFWRQLVLTADSCVVWYLRCPRVVSVSLYTSNGGAGRSAGRLPSGRGAGPGGEKVNLRSGAWHQCWHPL